MLLKNQDAQIKHYLNAINLLTAEKQVLMSQLLTGKRRIKLSEAEMEPQP